MQRQPLAHDQRERIAAGLPFVESLARRVASSMPHSIELGDLVQDGMLGLIDAACRFDEARGIKFETFAERRVRGAMIDALRRDAWPRGVRRSAASSRPRAKSCVASSARSRRSPISPRASAPTRRGSAARSSGSTRSSRRRRSRLARTSTARRCRRRSCPPSRSRPTRPTRSAKCAIASAPRSRRCRRASARSSASTTTREATMKQIGAAIGVNESRVSQLHARAIQRLRKALGAECSAAEAAAALKPAILSFQQTMRRMNMAQGECQGDPDARDRRPDRRRARVQGRPSSRRQAPRAAAAARADCGGAVARRVGSRLSGSRL